MLQKILLTIYLAAGSVAQSVPLLAEDPGAQGVYCSDAAQVHPAAESLAQQFSVPYTEIMNWFCQGLGLGEIKLAYTLAQSAYLTPEEIFAARQSGAGWGEVKKQFAPSGPPAAAPESLPKAPLSAAPNESPSESPAATPPASHAGPCDPGSEQPHGEMLAARFGVTYEEILTWFCQGFGFGEIQQAYELALQMGALPADLFAQRTAGLGWGEIKQNLGVIGNPQETPPAAATEKPSGQGKPEEKNNPPGKPTDKPPKNKP